MLKRNFNIALLSVTLILVLTWLYYYKVISDRSLLDIREFSSVVYSRSSGSKSTNRDDQLYIEDIFIAIKTTKEFHSQRLPLLLDTWIPQANGSVHPITDGEDDTYSKIFGKSNFINTGCGATHHKSHLVCKLQSTYNTYMSKKEQYKWWCTVDDDTYLIVPNLVKLLRNYDHNKDLYIGRTSLTEPYSVELVKTKKEISYWFATGGAGICISRGLAVRMSELCSGNNFIMRGNEITNPDDTTLGYVINYLLGIGLTYIPEFHSHLERLWMIHPRDFHKQITLSWGEAQTERVLTVKNRILIRDEIPQFPDSVDDTRGRINAGYYLSAVWFYKYKLSVLGATLPQLFIEKLLKAVWWIDFE